MENTKNNNNIIVIILAIVILVLCGYIIYDKVIDKKNSDSSSNTQEEKNNQSNNGKSKDNTNKEVSESVLSELYDILRMDPSKTECPFSFEDLEDGFPNDYDASVKKYIVFRIALDKGLAHYISQEEIYGYTRDGDGHEYGIAESDYYKIAKKYNITDRFEDLYEEIYEGKGLTPHGGYSCDYIYNRDLSAKYEGDYVVLYDTIKILDRDSLEEEETIKKKFTFNKLSDGSYALYKVESE